MKCPLCHNEHVEEAACADQPRDSRVGQVVGGKYRVLRKLAEGGMGSVYEAHHTDIERPFALKFIHHTLAGDQEWLDRFKREARAAGGLVNDHITAVLDFGTTPDGSPYIVMEMLRGVTLSDRFEQGARISPDEALDLVSQACVGIEAAHARGIVHRDIKPDNLFLCDRDAGGILVKILDFGIARVIGTKATRATKTGRVMGTPGYMSPEQARGERQLDARTDIYALGVILYELLCERQMFVADSYNAILYKVLNDDIPRIDQAIPDISPELADVVHRAINRDLNARYQQITEFRADLDRANKAPAPKVRNKTAPYGVAALDPADPSPDSADSPDDSDDDSASRAENQSDPVGATTRGLEPPSADENDSPPGKAQAQTNPRSTAASVPMTKSNPLLWIGAMVASLITMALLMRASDSPAPPRASTNEATQQGSPAAASAEVDSRQAAAPTLFGDDPAPYDTTAESWTLTDEHSTDVPLSGAHNAMTEAPLLSLDAGSPMQAPAIAESSPTPEAATAGLSANLDRPNPDNPNPDSAGPPPSSVASPRALVPASSGSNSSSSVWTEAEETPAENGSAVDSSSSPSASPNDKPGAAHRADVGTLTVNSSIPAKLLINGAPVGDLPIASLKLTPGSHKLVAIDNDSGKRVRRSFTVRPGELTLVSLDWSRAVTVKRKPPPPAQPSADCSPPWTISPDGIRTPKADCVRIENPYR